MHGIIHHVYVPYIMSSPWQLHGSEKTNKIYEAYYEKIRLRERLTDIALELATYNNVFVYFLNGAPITLPVDKCRIGSLQLNGEPLVEFDCQTILEEYRYQGCDVHMGWIEESDPQIFLQAFPPEVVDALNRCATWVQLNPKYTKVLQGPKDAWAKYAIPFIAAALPALQQKDIIRKYETAILNLGIHSFVHMRYGGMMKERDVLPNEQDMGKLHRNTSKAMNGFPLLTSDYLAQANVVQPDMDDLFQWDKYKNVNNDILSAGGISGVIVTGTASDGATFSSSQVSMQTAEARILAMRELICELMNKLNFCIKEELLKRHTYNVKDVPTFTFLPLELSGSKALRDRCYQLWKDGVISTATMMDTEGYDLMRELHQREMEKDHVDEVFAPRVTNVQQTSDEGGRPEMSDEERHSDPEASTRGAQPKPSTAE